MEIIGNKWTKAGNTALFIVIASVLAFCIWLYGEKVGLDEKYKKTFSWGLAVLIFGVFRLLPIIVGIYRQEHIRRKIEQEGLYPVKEKRLKVHLSEDEKMEIINFHLSRRYGRFWRFKVRILMVMGELEQVESIAPGLTAQPDLTIDGQRLRYFNQMESWQRLRWPGESDNPGVVLTWTNVNTGARVFGDYPGEWGLLCWLEQAQVKALDGGRYRLRFNGAGRISADLGFTH